MKYIKVFEELSNAPAETPESHIKTRISELLIPARSAAKSASKVLDADSIINKMEKFLVEKIPSQLNTAKTGVGGAKFAYECYQELSKLVDEGLASISGFKKAAINLAAPSRQKFKELSNNPYQYSLYFDNFTEAVDFAYMVGWMPQFKPYEAKLEDYSNQVTNWLNKNQKAIISSLTAKVENFIYGPAK